MVRSGEEKSAADELSTALEAAIKAWCTLMTLPLVCYAKCLQKFVAALEDKPRSSNQTKSESKQDG